MDFRLAAGVDPSVIELDVSDSDCASLDRERNLVLGGDAGELGVLRPIAYQERSDGGRDAVHSELDEGSRRTVSLVVGDYAPERPLIIDPVLTYSTYVGGNSADRALGVAVDGSGAVYVTGDTFSTDFPVVNAIPGQTGPGTST